METVHEVQHSRERTAKDRMLSAEEKRKCRELLSKLDAQDLNALTDTVTNRVVSPENRNEAIDAILLFSQDVEQLLRRKKMKRDVLFLFLTTKGVVVSPAADKPFLIRKLLELWGCRPKEETEVGKDEEDEEDLSQPPPPPHTPSQSSHSGSADGQILAEHFVPWFFSILNLASQENVVADWGPQHFWDDSCCKVLMISDGNTVDECNGSLASSDKLLNLVRTEKITFNVNENGIKGLLDAYGLARITTGGTVHRFSQCIGIFEQAFGLIRDPQMQNNWKIKFTELKLRACQALEDTNALTPSSNCDRLALQYK